MPINFHPPPSPSAAGMQTALNGYKIPFSNFAPIQTAVSWCFGCCDHQYDLKQKIQFKTINNKQYPHHNTKANQ